MSLRILHKHLVIKEDDGQYLDFLTVTIALRSLAKVCLGSEKRFPRFTTIKSCKYWGRDQSLGLKMPPIPYKLNSQIV